MNQKGGDVLGWDKVQKNLNTQLDQFSSSLQSIATSAGEWFLPKATAFVQWANGAIAYFKQHPLITRIATDAALAAFGVALFVKVKKAFEGIKAVFGMGAMQLNTSATELNTAALNRLAGVMGVSDIPGGPTSKIPKSVKTGLKVVAPIAAVLGTSQLIKSGVVDPAKKGLTNISNTNFGTNPTAPQAKPGDLKPGYQWMPVGPGGVSVQVPIGSQVPVGGYKPTGKPTTNKVKVKVSANG